MIYKVRLEEIKKFFPHPLTRLIDHLLSPTQDAIHPVLALSIPLL